MNVAPARNCVSTSHFAAATCHYCTITVCTTIVASRTSLASLTITLEIVLDFCTKKKKKKEKRHARVSIVYYGSSSKSRSRADEYPGRAVQKSSFYSITFFFLVLFAILHEAFLSRLASPCELLICESCARTNTIHLNPIILADYWLDSVCSLCRWSRLTLSLPCLVRLHIYIINYITLLIIIFTPSRSHA